MVRYKLHLPKSDKQVKRLLPKVTDSFTHRYESSKTKTQRTWLTILTTFPIKAHIMGGYTTFWFWRKRASTKKLKSNCKKNLKSISNCKKIHVQYLKWNGLSFFEKTSIPRCKGILNVVLCYSITIYWVYVVTKLRLWPWAKTFFSCL